MIFKASELVHHLEFDKFKDDGSILIGTKSRFITFNNDEHETLQSFSVPSFVQVNVTHVVLVDATTWCLRILNRKTNVTSPVLKGTCFPSHTDEPNLYKPWKVIEDIRNPGNLLVTDRQADLLMSVDVKNGEWSSVAARDLHMVESMQWMGQQLLLTSKYNVTRLTWSDEGAVSVEIIAGSDKSGDELGKLLSAKFNQLAGIGKLEKNKFILADSLNFKMKLMDMDENTIGPVCYETEFPKYKKCKCTEWPYSFLSDGDTLYVGTNEGVQKLSGKLNLRLPAHENVTHYFSKHSRNSLTHDLTVTLVQ